MYDLVLHPTYFFVAPNTIDATSIVIEKLNYCNDHVIVTWNVHTQVTYLLCSCMYCV